MKEQLLNLARTLKAIIGLPTLLMILVMLILFGINLWRDWARVREAEQDAQRIEQFEKRFDKVQAVTDGYLKVFEQSNAVTLSLMGTVKDMSVNIKALAETDRAMDVRVNNLREDYQNARLNKPIAVSKTNNVRVARRNRTLTERENDALSNDKRLYPAAGDADDRQSDSDDRTRLGSSPNNSN